MLPTWKIWILIQYSQLVIFKIVKNCCFGQFWGTEIDFWWISGHRKFAKILIFYISKDLKVQFWVNFHTKISRFPIIWISQELNLQFEYFSYTKISNKSKNYIFVKCCRELEKKVDLTSVLTTKCAHWL